LSGGFGGLGRCAGRELLVAADDFMVEKRIFFILQKNRRFYKLLKTSEFISELSKPSSGKI
jgi:hypothetical protein